MTTIRNLLRRGCIMIGRRMSIKRRLDTGYESTWQDITDDVVSWGSYEKGFGDSAFVGEYQIGGTSITLNNGTRRYNDENDPSSFFYKCKTRWGTKFKVELFLIDDDDSEVEGFVFYGLLYGDPETSDNGEISISISSYLKALQNYPASTISTAQGTTAEIVDRLLKIEVGGSRLFDNIAEGANDTSKYSVNPESKTVTTISNLTIDDDETVWDVIKRMSLYDNFFIYVNNDGGFVWTSRDATASTVFNFNGAGSLENTDAVNIISVDSEISGNANIWNRCVVEYGANKTKLTSGASWSPGDNSTLDKYGERIYTISAPDLDIVGAQIVADNFRNEYQEQRKEWQITTPIIPHLEVKDACTLSYLGEIVTSSPFMLGVSLLGGSHLLGRRNGSLSINNQAVKIIDITHDLDGLVSTFMLREV